MMSVCDDVPLSGHRLKVVHTRFQMSSSFEGKLNFAKCASMKHESADKYLVVEVFVCVIYGLIGEDSIRKPNIL